MTLVQPTGDPFEKGSSHLICDHILLRFCRQTKSCKFILWLRFYIHPKSESVSPTAPMAKEATATSADKDTGVNSDPVPNLQLIIPEKSTTVSAKE